MAQKKQTSKSNAATKSKVPPSPSTQQSGGDSDSDFPSEVLSSKKASRPAPGSPDFIKLDAVTISPRKADLAAVSRKLEFGQLSEEESSHTTSLRPPAEMDNTKRSRKPSQKAVYMTTKSSAPPSDDTEETPKPKRTPWRDQGKGKAAMARKDSDSSEVELISSTGPSYQERPSTVKAVVKSIEIMPLAPQSTKESDTPAPKRLRLIPNSPEVPARPSEKSPELLSQSSDIAEEEDLDVEHGVDVVQEQDDDDVQDVLLCKLYSKLPKYPGCTLTPFGAGTSGQAAPSEFNLLQFSPLLEALPGVQPKNFHNSVNWTKCGQFVNPTRDQVTSVVLDKDRLVIPGTKRPAVFLTTGIVSTCNLISPTSNKEGVLIKKIQAIPVIYEYRRLLNFLGARYGKTDLYGYVSPEVALSFSSRKEGAGQNTPNPSPKKGSRFFMTSKAPPPPTPTGHNPSSYPNYRNFNENIPIYDCRETRFRFNEQAFSTINNLPVCTEDLEPDSLVSIAYTVNSFPYAQVAQTPKTDIAVLFNVLFVLFLGQLPEDSPRSESE